MPVGRAHRTHMRAISACQASPGDSDSLAEQNGFEPPVPVVCLSKYFTASLPGYLRKLLLEQYGKAGPVAMAARQSDPQPIACDTRNADVRTTADVTDNCASLIRLLVYRRTVR